MVTTNPQPTQGIEFSAMGEAISKALNDRHLACKDLLLREGESLYANTPAGISPLGGYQCSREDLTNLAATLEPEWEKLIRLRAIDRPYIWGEQCLRINVASFDAGRSIEAVIRPIAPPPALSELALSDAAKSFIHARRGLILVVGATSAGKSTTLAAMIEYLNQHHRGHIVTLENPIEHRYINKSCVVTQRELGIDIPSYSIGLQDALRQAPFAILVGEVRTEEAAQAVLEAAESGHLVLASMHASTAVGAINKLCAWGKARGEGEVRQHAVADNLVGVIAQTLLPDRTKTKWVPVFEVLPVTQTVKDLIMVGNFSEISSKLAGRGESGDSEIDGGMGFARAIADAVHGERIAQREGAEFLNAASNLFSAKRSR